MANENVQMWTELNIDLKSHDLLLGALGPMFRIYISPRKTARRGWVLRFCGGDIHGIRVKELREHAKNGGKVVATYCVFVPEELVWAAGGFPLGFVPERNFPCRWRKKFFPVTPAR